jgi:hypothetical protein
MVMNPKNIAAGCYWARFPWGWEPARFDGEDWLRFGTEETWNDDVIEVGAPILRVDVDLTNN